MFDHTHSAFADTGVGDRDRVDAVAVEDRLEDRAAGREKMGAERIDEMMLWEHDRLVRWR